jgi:hypothetical protein
LANGSGGIKVGQPSGVTVVDARVVPDDSMPGGVRAEYGAVYRTARRLFEGRVLCRMPNLLG